MNNPHPKTCLTADTQAPIKLLLVEDNRLSMVSKPIIARITPAISNLRSMEMLLHSDWPLERLWEGLPRVFAFEREVCLLPGLEVDFRDDFVDLRAVMI